MPYSKALIGDSVGITGAAIKRQPSEMEELPGHMSAKLESDAVKQEGPCSNDAAQGPGENGIASEAKEEAADLGPVKMEAALEAPCAAKLAASLEKKEAVTRDAPKAQTSESDETKLHPIAGEAVVKEEEASSVKQEQGNAETKISSMSQEELSLRPWAVPSTQSSKPSPVSGDRDHLSLQP